MALGTWRHEVQVVHYCKVQKRDLKVLKQGRAIRKQGRVQSRNAEEGKCVEYGKDNGRV